MTWIKSKPLYSINPSLRMLTDLLAEIHGGDWIKVKPKKLTKPDPIFEWELRTEFIKEENTWIK